MSITHLGGANFLYMFPGRENTIVGKLEFGRKKYRIHGISLAGLVVAAVTTMTFMSQPDTATSIDHKVTSKKSENREDVALLEERSEELKTEILKEEKPVDQNQPFHIINYKIKPGDTLSELGSRYKVDLQLIAASSGIRPFDTLRPGQELKIPSKPGLIYSIKKGESLAQVAQKYSVQLEQIMRDNPEVADLDLMEPGTRLFLPNARIPDPPSPWVRPAYGRITSRYGWRIHPILKTRQKHTGMDIGLYYRPVYAARNGVVIYAGRLGSYGNVVVIKHDTTFKTLYAHLSRVNVRKGQFVKAGRVVAISGNTGLSTGPHMHFEVIKNGVPVNPRRYVRF